MATVPAKAATRLTEGLKRFQPVLKTATDRDLNESDTATIVTDMLADAFGYDKYSEITSEYAIRGTYCDLAVKLDGKIHMLIEVKAIGIDLKESHAKQATDYGANQGVEWIVLTNGVNWRIYRIIFGQPIEKEEVVDMDLLSMNPRSKSDIKLLYLLAREGILKSALDDYHAHRQALSRNTVAAVMLSEPVVKVVRRELARLSPDVKVSLQEVEAILTQEIIKRDILEGKEAQAAIRKAQRALEKTGKSKQKQSSSGTRKQTSLEEQSSSP